MDYKKKYLKYKLKYLLAKKKIQKQTIGGRKPKPKVEAESSWVGTGVSALTNLATGIPGFGKVINAASKMWDKSHYFGRIEKELNRPYAKKDGATFTINNIMKTIQNDYNSHDSSLMIQQLNANIKDYLRNWHKANKGKEHWYKTHLNNTIRKNHNKLSGLLDKIKDNAKDTLTEETKAEVVQTAAKYLKDTAGLDLTELGILEPTKFDDIREALGNDIGDLMAELGGLTKDILLASFGGTAAHADGNKKK